jgi:hypothetical protein
MIMYKEITQGPIWDHMLTWAERISEPLAANNGWPVCPYARKALVNKSIRVWTAENYLDLKDIAQQILPRAWSIDIVVFDIPDYLDDWVEDINFDMEHENVYALADDPAKPGDIAGHNPSNGQYPVILLQDREDLMHKRASLRSTNYYSTWAQWYKDFVLKSDLS